MWKTDPLYELLKDRLYPLKEKLTQKKKNWESRRNTLQKK